MSRTMNRIPAFESQRIDDISNTVMTAKAALAACVGRLEPERLAKIHQTSTSALSEAQAIRQTMSRNHNIMMHAMAEIASRQSELILPYDSTMREMFKECFREVLASQMQTGLYRLVEENQYSQSEHFVT